MPSDIEVLFNDPSTKDLTASVRAPNVEELPLTDFCSCQSDPFFHLVHALQLYTSQPPHTLPLSATLPDMKSDTKSYIHLQLLYKAQAEEDKSRFADLLRGVQAGSAGGGSNASGEASGASVALEMIDDFVKNAHALKLIRGKKWIGDGGDPAALGGFGFGFDAELALTFLNNPLAEAITMSPASVGVHLALCALSAFESKNGRLPGPAVEADLAEMKAWAKTKLNAAGWTPEPTDSAMTGGDEQEEDDETPKELTLWDHVENAVGEVYVFLVSLGLSQLIPLLLDLGLLQQRSQLLLRLWVVWSLKRSSKSSRSSTFRSMVFVPWTWSLARRHRSKCKHRR